MKIEYTCAAGDTFDSAALKLYGDEKYAAVLMAFNTERCGKMVFDGGEALTAPLIDLPEGEDERTAPAIAPWRL